MRAFLRATGAVLMIALVPALAYAADPPGIAGTYKLMKRTLADGTTIASPAVVGLMTFSGGFRNFNVAWKAPDGKQVSLSVIAEYTMSNGKFCENVIYWAANNLASAGLSYDAPASTKPCSAVTTKEGRTTFQMPGEQPVAAFASDGMTATAAGQFVDYWKKLD